jgi:integrase
MPERKRIGLREVRALKKGEIEWDGALPGFGARRQRGEVIAYVLKYRTAEGRQRWHTIGRHGAPWTPEMAREEAIRVLGDVVRGIDPATEKAKKRKALTVGELCEIYIDDAEAGRLLTRSRFPKKLSTLAIDKGRIERHIKPLIGKLPVAAVRRDDIERLLHDIAEGRTAGSAKTAKKRGLARVRGGRTAATRTVGLLGGIFTFAMRRGIRPDNPVHGVVRFADGRRDRRLSDDEYRALGEALAKARAGGIWPAAVAAAHFLALTGWRSGEALSLQWGEVDLVRRTAILPDTKTGRSLRPLSSAACNVLRSLTTGEGLVFPATRGDGPMLGFPKLWARIAELGGMPDDVTPHTLRHSFASLGADLGYSELTIGALIGHKGQCITSRYMHAADAVLLAAADTVSDRTAELMGLQRATNVVVELRQLAR